MLELILFTIAVAAAVYIAIEKWRARRPASVNRTPEVERSTLPPGKTPGVNWFKKAIYMSTHLLIVGKTESGKSMLTTALIIARSYVGKVIIISPIAKPQDYGGLGIHAVGRGENFEAIRRVFLALLDERQRRAELLARTGETLEPITIVVDEVPLLFEKMEADITNFMSNIGSSGRHYNMRGIFLSQSSLIKDIGGSTAMRQNFNIIYLGPLARQLAKTELKKPEIFNGVEYPALIDDDGELKIINRDFIPHIFAGGQFALDGKLYAGFNYDALFDVSSSVLGLQIEAKSLQGTAEHVPEQIRELASKGYAPTRIARSLGGNYQKRLRQVKDILEV